MFITQPPRYAAKLYCSKPRIRSDSAYVLDSRLVSNETGITIRDLKAAMLESGMH